MARNEPRRGAEAAPDRVARRLVRSAFKGALATLDRSSGHPYASLVTVATDAAGEPLLLVSRLALHTQNLEHDARASLLVDASGGDGDPLAGGRVSVIGRAVRLDRGSDAAERRRFLARHPAAEGYASFADFAFWRLVVERAHYVGGFGRIVSLAREDVVLDLAGREGLLAAEDDILAHMNADHADTLALCATRLLGAEPADWRMTGIDPEGLDLVAGGEGLRLDFDSPIGSPAEARVALAALARAARSSD
ncbi:MAG: DUF2470 domain-containing protein [Pseudomonadota bacterium]